MPGKSRSHDPKDALEVDRLLKQLRPLDGRTTTPSGVGVRPAPRPGARAPGSTTLSAPRGVTLPSPWGVWGRVALAAALAGGLMLWPYRTCGLPLAGYMAAVAVSLVAGLWGAHAAWRRRMALAHGTAVVVVFIGLALAAHQLLTRVGYAAIQAPWGCGG
ncbi:MAG: hypothetical protein R3314_05805 [Longimicrobiales bacterium]|nr:hypothetical protein [Longimicrobiales bacterium]